MLEVKFYDNVADEFLEFAVIITKTNGKWVFCKHRDRDTFEVPGGHREYGENIDDTAKRELYEETGAIKYSIEPICIYSVVREDNNIENERFGKLYFADVFKFEDQLHNEIEKILITDSLVENWTYPLIQPRLLEEAKRRGYINPKLQRVESEVKNMKRLYSKRDFKGYTNFKQVLYDLELYDKNYLWLINDIDACPRKQEYQTLLDNNTYLLLTTSELINMLEDDDFQWIWAVFSAIPDKYEKEDILKFDLPYVEHFEEGKYNPHLDIPKLQHPYADFEIYAVDSSYMFMITDNKDMICKFQKRYPQSIDE